jgi:hypothetical protein
LLEAVLESDVVRVYHLLAQGASLDYQDANKKYVLALPLRSFVRCSARECALTVVRVLLLLARSVLHHAVEEDKTNLFCLELLVQSGAKVHRVSTGPSCRVVSCR